MRTLARQLPEWRHGAVRHPLGLLVHQRVFQLACLPRLPINDRRRAGAGTMVGVAASEQRPLVFVVPQGGLLRFRRLLGPYCTVNCPADRSFARTAPPVDVTTICKV
jgi:hypothetical protein